MMFDLIIFVAILAAVVLKKRTEMPSNALLLGLLAVVIIHIFMGFPRWQLIPLYLGVIATIIVVLRPSSKRIMVPSSIIGVLSGLTLALLWAFPVYPMPEPGGDYLIGTQSFILDDQDREELYDSEVDNRRFKIQIWYPTTFLPLRSHRILPL